MTIASSQTTMSDGRMTKFKWSGLGNSSGTTVGDWVGFSDFADKTVLTTGTFGPGGTILTWQGSVNGNTSDAVAFTLHDPGGTNLASSIAVGHTVLEAVEYIRPAVTTAGTSTASLDAYLFGRKNPI
jgi:hypothetical protein